jgi:hypothetical protein
MGDRSPLIPGNYKEVRLHEEEYCNDFWSKSTDIATRFASGTAAALPVISRVPHVLEGVKIPP